MQANDEIVHVLLAKCLNSVSLNWAHVPPPLIHIPLGPEKMQPKFKAIKALTDERFH